MSPASSGLSKLGLGPDQREFGSIQLATYCDWHRTFNTKFLFFKTRHLEGTPKRQRRSNYCSPFLRSCDCCLTITRLYVGGSVVLDGGTVARLTPWIRIGSGSNQPHRTWNVSRGSSKKKRRVLVQSNFETKLTFTRNSNTSIAVTS